MNSLVEALAGYARTQPEKLFAADSRDSMSYSEAWQKTVNVANNLKNRFGILKGDKVLVQCDQSIEYLTVYLGCSLCGAVFVPVEENASGERVRGIANEAECRLLVNIEGKGAVTTIDELVSAAESPYDIVFPCADDVTEILYTTGTTGKSKGIVLTNRADIALAENIKFGVHMRENNVELIPLAMSHSHGLRTFYANLLNGSAVILVNGVMNVTRIFQLMEKYGVTSLDLSPSATQILIKLSKGVFWEKAGKLDYIEIGTAALGEDLKEQLIQNLPGVHLYNFYGSTESGRTCALDFSVTAGKMKCIGKPSKNARIIFTDDQRNPIEATQEKPGLLASSGAMNMLCYWKNEELTREVLVNGYVCTNDLGYFDEEGYAYIIGRMDDVINFNGIKISPAEIEDVVMEHPEIAEVACVGKEDPLTGQYPKLFVVLKENAAFDMEEFKGFLREHLDKTKTPKMVEVINSLPRTFNGKLNRKELAQM